MEKSLQDMKLDDKSMMNL